MNVFLKYKQLLPLVVLTGLCGYLILATLYPLVEIEGDFYYLSLSPSHIGSCVAVVIDFVCFFMFRQYYKYLLFITLVLGVFGIINFVTSKTYFNAGPLSVGLHITPILVGFLAMAINYKRFGKNPTNDAGEPFERITINTAPTEEEIETFKRRFGHSSSEELTILLSDQRYTAAALEAARRILHERQTNA